jgi:hypothetical protein
MYIEVLVNVVVYIYLGSCRTDITTEETNYMLTTDGRRVFEIVHLKHLYNEIVHLKFPFV